MFNAQTSKVPVRIALVDDHALFREAIHLYLHTQAPSYEVVLEAANGKQLMESLLQKKLTAHPPDVVILDLFMPEMDGYETLVWLTSRYPRIRTVMLTMFSDRETILKCLRLGACAFLSKHGAGTELLQTIEKVLEKGYHYSDAVAAIAVDALKEKRPAPPQSDGIVLSDRELELLRLFCTECTMKEIAQTLNISIRTVDIYRDRLFEKLKTKTRVGLVMVAINKKLIEVSNSPAKMNAMIRNFAAQPNFPQE